MERETNKVTRVGSLLFGGMSGNSGGACGRESYTPFSFNLLKHLVGLTVKVKDSSEIGDSEEREQHLFY